jgi:hypothetical protein
MIGMLRVEHAFRRAWMPTIMTCALAPEVMLFLPQRLKPIYRGVFETAPLKRCSTLAKYESRRLTQASLPHSSLLGWQSRRGEALGFSPAKHMRFGKGL